MRNAMLINEKDNVIVAIEPLSKGTNPCLFILPMFCAKKAYFRSA